MSSDSIDEKVQTKDQHEHGVSISTKQVDTGAQLVAGLQGDVDPAEGLRIRYDEMKLIL